MHTRELNSQAFGVKNITEPRKPLNQTDILPKGFLIVLNLKIFVPDMTPEPRFHPVGNNQSVARPVSKPGVKRSKCL